MTEPDPAPIDLGHGLVQDADTLRPRVADRAAAQAWAAAAADPYAWVILALADGDLDRALQALERVPVTTSPLRRRILTADLHRDAGRFAVAVALYRDLCAETSGPQQEALVCQHFGKTLLLAGRLDEAAEMIGRALELRSADRDCPADQLASTRQALAETERRRTAARPGGIGQ